MLRKWQTEASEQVEAAVAATIREPLPDPDEEDWCALSNRQLTDGFSGE